MLNVLESTRPVVDSARHVGLNQPAVKELAQRWAAGEMHVPGWDTQIHFGDGTDRAANYVLLLDALNFCFWADPGQPRWEVEHRGQRYNGYKALSVALMRAVEAGVPLTEASYLAELTEAQLRHVLGYPPMLAERLHNAREVGRVLQERWEGRFSSMVEHARGSAPALALLIERELESFRDVATYAGREVRFLKRAQITVVDLYGTFQGQGWGQLADLSQLTAFADYKIPQILRTLGVLEYSPELAASLDRMELIPAGDPREVEIRAGMVWAVEELRRALAERGRPLAPFEIDWYLWNEGQRPQPGERPYHRTRTIFY
ncbi:MAG: queuosine salvage family protein [Candidatus Eremiobacterota bacterium]